MFLGSQLDSAGGGWNKSFGDGKTQLGRKVVVGESGDVVVSGLLMGDADFGGGKLSGIGSTDYFLAKFDQALGHIWSRAVVGPNSKSASVGIDAKGDVFAFGDFNGSLEQKLCRDANYYPVGLGRLRSHSRSYVGHVRRRD